jgi:hypothetical protein
MNNIIREIQRLEAIQHERVKKGAPEKVLKAGLAKIQRLEKKYLGE